MNSNVPEILLVDDEQRETTRLSDFIGEYYTDVGYNHIHSFNSGTAALEYFAGGKPTDLVFLDIIMPELSGVEIAKRLREQGFTGPIVFLTSSNDFAAESYAVEAFSYILKPVEKEQFFSLMQKIEAARIRSRQEDTAAVPIQTKQYNKIVLFRELVFVEVTGHKLFIHLENGEEISINKTLSNFAPALLEDERFAYCHNSIIVNMDFVDTIKNNATVLKTGQIIPISRRHREFKSLFIARSIRAASRGTEQ
jgi:DNA-binding LytR/AlgR family response regulator